MPDSRVRIWFSLFVLAVFCVGIATGVLLGRRMHPDLPERPRFGFGGAGPDRPGGRGGPPPGVLLQRLTRDLDLDATQREQVSAVLEASRERVRELQRGTRGRFEAEQRRLREDIRGLLRPEQQQRFDRWPGPRGRNRGPL